MSWRGESQRHAMAARGILLNRTCINRHCEPQVEPLVRWVIRHYSQVVKIELFGSCTLSTGVPHDVDLFIVVDVHTTDQKIEEIQTVLERRYKDTMDIFVVRNDNKGTEFKTIIAGKTLLIWRRMN